MPFTVAQSHPKEKWEKKYGELMGLGNVLLKKNVRAHLHVTSFRVCQESSSEILLLICVKENSFCDSE